MKGGRAGLIRWRGAAVTLTSESTANDESSDTVTVTTTTVAGYALRVDGDAERYAQLELNEDENPTLEFLPTTAGEEPALGARFSFGGVPFTIRERTPITTNGSVATWRIMGTR